MSLWVATIERTESFTIDVELDGAGSEEEAIKKAKEMLANDSDMGGQWSDSLEVTFTDAWED